MKEEFIFHCSRVRLEEIKELLGVLVGNYVTSLCVRKERRFYLLLSWSSQRFSSLLLWSSHTVVVNHNTENDCGTV